MFFAKDRGLLWTSGSAGAAGATLAVSRTSGVSFKGSWASLASGATETSGAPLVVSHTSGVSFAPLECPSKDRGLLLRILFRNDL